MPRRKPRPEKIIQEKIKESLDSIIMEESLDTIGANPVDLPRMKSTEIMDFAAEKNSALSEAQALLDSITDFYMDPEIHGSSEHVEWKKRMDAKNLSAMMFQLKSSQHAITKLLEDIDLGNMHPRSFEVLAQLQSQIMQMPKDYQAYLEKMENNYRKSKTEIEDKRIAGGVIMDQNGDEFTPNAQSMGSANIKSRGTRGIMEGIRGILGEEIVDIKPLDVDPGQLVNARDKKIIEAQSGINIQDDDEGDTYIVEDDIIE